jgi:PAS domain-containing protein
VGASTLFVFVALKRVTETAGRSAPTIVNDDYRTLFDTDPAPQWLYAMDSGEVLALNAAAAKLYGLTADSVTAVSAEALIRPLPPSPQSSMRLTHQTVGGRARELETHVSSHSFSGRHCHLVTVRDTACEHLSESLFAEALAKVQPVLYRFDPVRECYDYISDRGADWLDAPIHALCSPGGWQQFARRVDTKDLDRIRISIGDALKTPGDEPVEINVAYQLKSRTGPRWISDAMTLLRHPDGSLRAIVGAASDQTEEQCVAGKRTDQRRATGRLSRTHRWASSTSPRSYSSATATAGWPTFLSQVRSNWPAWTCIHWATKPSCRYSTEPSRPAGRLRWALRLAAIDRHANPLDPGGPRV